MSRTEAAQADSPLGVVPTPKPAAAWRVTSVHPRPGMILDVTFADGTRGEVRMEAFLASESVRNTIFEALREPTFFEQARVALGAVSWPNGADLAPDAMYDAIRAHGHWPVEP